jgi:hypothetical protein
MQDRSKNNNQRGFSCYCLSCDFGRFWNYSCKYLQAVKIRETISSAGKYSVYRLQYAAHLIIKGLAQEIDDDNITSKGTKEAKGSANVSLELEAILFLSSLVPNESCQAIILLEEELEASIKILAKNRSVMKFSKRQFCILAVVHAS